MVLNVAVTLCAPLIVTTHVPVPAHPPPDQPANVDPDPATVVSVTCVRELNLAEHVAPPQLIPAGLDVTVPEPVPLRFTVNAYCVEDVTTTPVGADDADVHPLGLQAVTTARMVSPTSFAVSVYLLEVAPLMSEQRLPLELQSSHW